MPSQGSRAKYVVRYPATVISIVIIICRVARAPVKIPSHVNATQLISGIMSSHTRKGSAAERMSASDVKISRIERSKLPYIKVDTTPIPRAHKNTTRIVRLTEGASSAPINLPTRACAAYANPSRKYENRSSTFIMMLLTAICVSPYLVAIIVKPV